MAALDNVPAFGDDSALLNSSHIDVNPDPQLIDAVITAQQSLHLLPTSDKSTESLPKIVLSGGTSDDNMSSRQAQPKSQSIEVVASVPQADTSTNQVMATGGQRENFPVPAPTPTLVAAGDKPALAPQADTSTNQVMATGGQRENFPVPAPTPTLVAAGDKPALAPQADTSTNQVMATGRQRENFPVPVPALVAAGDKPALAPQADTSTNQVVATGGQRENFPVPAPALVAAGDKPALAPQADTSTNQVMATGGQRENFPVPAPTLVAAGDKPALAPQADTSTNQVMATGGQRENLPVPVPTLVAAGDKPALAPQADTSTNQVVATGGQRENFPVPVPTLVAAGDKPALAPQADTSTNQVMATGGQRENFPVPVPALVAAGDKPALAPQADTSTNQVMATGRQRENFPVPVPALVAAGDKPALAPQADTSTNQVVATGGQRENLPVPVPTLVAAGDKPALAPQADTSTNQVMATGGQRENFPVPAPTLVAAGDKPALAPQADTSTNQVMATGGQRENFPVPAPTLVAAGDKVDTKVSEGLNNPIASTRVVSQLAQTETQQLLAQQQATGGAFSKSEVLSQGTNIPPTVRVSINPQLAIARETVHDLATAQQSYSRSVSPESKTTTPLPPTDSHGHGGSQIPPGTIPGAPASKDGGKTTLPPDPPTLLAALEAAAIRKISTPGTTSAFIDGAVSTSKLGLSPLQGARAYEAMGIRQDAVGPSIIKTDVRGAGVPGAGIPGAPAIPGVPGTPGAPGMHSVADIRITQIAQAGGHTQVSLDGHLVQNPNQAGAIDTTSGAIDPRKGLGNVIPGALGPGISTERPEARDNKHILDVPNLNLDDKTGQLNGRKNKGDHETNQPDTGKTSREEQAAAELANFLNRVKKGQKENPEQDDKADATGAAQVLAGSTRLKHKVRLGETLSEISITYFNDDIAATLIMQINHLLLDPRVENYSVVVSLVVDSIIDIPSDAEVAEFRKQLIAGTQTLVNIVYD